MRHKVFRSAIIFLMALYVLQGCSLFGQRYLSQTMSNTSFEVRDSGNIIGTASIVRLQMDNCHYKYLILTAGHVIPRDSRRLTLHTRNNQSYSVDAFYRPIGLDIALIESKEINNDIRRGVLNNVLILGDSGFEDEDLARDIVVFYFGNRRPGHDLSTIIPSKGYVINATKKQLWLHAPLVGAGGSGAPVVLNDTHEVIGIVSRVETRKTYGFETGVVQAVPSNLVSELLRKYDARTGVISKRFYSDDSNAGLISDRFCLGIIEARY